MALSITITDAGRTALVNAQNTGSTAMVIDRIGVSASHATGDLKALTALPNERKKLATFAGEVVADDMIHVTVRDETNDAYDLRAFGIYFANGVLFAVCTQAEPIMQKAAAAILLQSVDIALITLDTANIEFGGAGFLNPPATTERLGVVELATEAETAALEDGTRAVTPFGLGRTLLAWAQNFASRLHGHDIGDVKDLSLALAGKASKDHKHDAADTTSGSFEVARIPKLAISWITGLADTLATLALKDHKHDAADIISGILSVGRIPALGMEKVTGLAAALAQKANLAGAIFTGPLGVSRRGGSAVLSIDGDAGRVRQVVWQTNGVARWIFQADEAAESGGNVGSDLVLMNCDDAGTYMPRVLRIKRETGVFHLGRRPIWDNLTPWDNGNFDPAGKVDHQARHLVDFNAAPVAPGLSIVHAGAASPGAPAAWAQGLQFGRTAGRTVQLLFDNEQGQGIYVRKTYGTEATPAWTDAVRLWHSGIFDPTTYAPLASPALTGSPTAPTQAAGNNSTRIATTAFVQQENAAQSEEVLARYWPAGELKLYDLAAVPSGVRAVIANGAAVSRSSYARLFAAIGTRYGPGDGSTTFNLPDWRGVFFRGLDGGRGLDPNRALSVYQTSQNLAHKHTIPSRSNADAGNGWVEDAGSTGTIQYAETGMEGGAEARPINYALLACITY